MKIAGVIRAAKTDQGSKSERLSYHIVDSEGGKTDLIKVGENPFSNPTLAPFEGQEVEISGELDGDVFLVKSIQRLG